MSIDFKGRSAEKTATLADIEVARMIREQQFQPVHTSSFKQVASLAA